MPRPAIEVAGIFRDHGPRYRATHRLPSHQQRLMRAIERCRTAALGGHVEVCRRCQHRRICYNSCRDRHCPKCQNLARARWLAQRKGELLPVPYFHVVFTVPDDLHALALNNQRTFYRILLQTSAATLQTIAHDPKHLGASIGFFSILHTWGQNLMFHPHVHCVVTGGGLNPDGSRWIPTRPGFFLPVRVLSRLFRRLFLQALQRSFPQLRGHAALPPRTDAAAFSQYLQPLHHREWVVYAKPPFGGPEHVLEYLGRYTHRVAIANQRLLAYDGQAVTFRYKDYRRAGRQKHKQMKIAADEFIRRFLLHSLPPGFQRIRHYGILASSQKKTKLAQARQILLVMHNELAPEPARITAVLASIMEPITRCPVCQTQGSMVIIEWLAPCLPPDTNDSS